MRLLVLRVIRHGRERLIWVDLSVVCTRGGPEKARDLGGGVTLKTTPQGADDSASSVGDRFDARRRAASCWVAWASQRMESAILIVDWKLPRELD